MRAFLLLRSASCAAALACAGCGAATTLDDRAFGGDASCPRLDASADAPLDAAPPPDGPLLDHGTNGYSDAALPRCQSQEDCDGWATCQSGLCCAGLLVDGGVCVCGEGPGCDLRHACCVPFTSQTKVPECVSDCATECGCNGPPR